MNAKIGNIGNYLAALILLTMGVIYLFKSSFMPYHSAAVMQEWGEINLEFQSLILALMRAVSGGYIATAIAAAVMQKKFSSTKVAWLPPLILIVGLIVSLASIYATLIVRFNTPGEPPTALAIAGIVLLLIGYVFNRRAITKEKNKE